MTLLKTLKSLSINPEERQKLEALFHADNYISLATQLSSQGFDEIAGDVFQKAFAFKDAFDAYHKASAWKKLCATAINSSDALLTDKCLHLLLEAQKAEEALAWIPQEAPLFKAKLLEQMNRHEEAAPIFESAGHWVSAAQAYEKVNNYGQAGMLYERLMKSNREDTQINICYSRILMELGQFSEAVKNLQLCLNHASSPVQRKVFPLLMVSFLALNLKESAKTTLERWKEIDESKDTPSHLDLFLRLPLATYYLNRQSAQQEDDASVILGGRYILTEPLDTTPMSERWVAFDRLSSTTVHVDILPEKWIETDSYQHAIQELHAINNQNLVGSIRYLDIKPYQNFLVKKPAAAPTLKQVLPNISWAEMRRQFYLLLDIIDNFHNAGWLHTQLNLSNIFWGPRHIEIDGWAFRHIKGHLQTLTSGDDSPWRFCAPEIFHNTAPGRYADIYSLTAILKHYFTCQAETLALNREEKELWDAFWRNNLSSEVRLRAPDIVSFRQQIPTWPINCDATKSPAASSVPNEVTLRHQTRTKLLFENEEYKLFESYHGDLHRNEWIVRFKTSESLDRLLPWANMQNGVQPVYRWLSEHNSAVIAPGAEQFSTIEALKKFPYSLMRDLSAVASALDTLHQTGLGLNGFEKNRCLGSYGPQLQLAPGPMPTQLTQESKEKDENSFIDLVAACFSLDGIADVWAALLQHFPKQNQSSEAAALTKLTPPASLSGWSSSLMKLSEQLKTDDAQHLFTHITNEIDMRRGRE